VSLPQTSIDGSRNNEFGDTEFVAYLQPRQARRFVWRFGPAILIPSASDDAAGSDKWSIGPAFAAVDIGDKFVYGIVGKMFWSVAGDKDADDYRVLELRPFINYNLENGWYLVSAAAIVGDFEASSENRWTIPLGGGFGRVFQLGEQIVNAQMQGFHFIEKPEGSPDWAIHLQIKLPFF